MKGVERREKRKGVQKRKGKGLHFDNGTKQWSVQQGNGISNY